MTKGLTEQKGAVKERKKIAHQYEKILGSQGKASPTNNLHKENLPERQSALK